MVGSKKEKCVVRYMLERNAKDIGDKVFFPWGDLKRTHKDMNERANRMANGFLDLGIKKGDNVLIFMPNCPEYIDAWFGLAKIGIIEVPINNAYKGNILQYVINNSEARIMVVHQSLLDRVRFVQDKLEYLEKLIVLADGSWDPDSSEGLKFEVVSFQKIIESSSASPPDPNIN